MSLEKLVKLHREGSRYSDILESVGQGTKLVEVQGLTASAKGWMIAGLYDQTRRPVLVLTYTYEQAERIAEDLPHYGISKEHVFFFPPSDSLIYEEGSEDLRMSGERLAALHALACLPGGHGGPPLHATACRRGGPACPPVVIAPVNAALRRTVTRDELLESVIEVAVGTDTDIDEIQARLVAMGYQATDVVDRPGEFSRRGGLVDVFAANEDNPLRIELFGDEVESIRHFDTASQRSIDKVASARILPAREVILTKGNCAAAAQRVRAELAAQIDGIKESGDAESIARLVGKVEDDITRLENEAYFPNIEFYLPYLHTKEQSLLDFLPADTLIVLDEPGQLSAQWQTHEEQMVERLINRAGRGLVLAGLHSQHAPFDHTIKSALARHQAVSFVLLPRPIAWARPDVVFEVKSAPAESFNGRIEAFADQLRTWKQHGMCTVIASNQDRRIAEILAEFDERAFQLDDVAGLDAGVYVSHVPLRSGYRLAELHLNVISDSEVFGEPRLRRARRAYHEGVPISSVLDLKEGDHVVHVNHGIAFYRGIKTMRNLGIEKEYLILEYAGSDTLYVPADQIDRVQKYIGGEDNGPTVHRLGGSDWQKATQKVRKAVSQIAKELVELYAWRQASGGHAYPADTPWQQEMESAFPYVETPDQLTAIQDVKRDLEKPRAMDRLICGDVGYGKTEVAIRAAFKVASEGRQVAVLSPTTVLAQQHASTFRERLAAFPIRIGLLSRFRSRAEQIQTVEALRIGDLDIVIGTHRLLSKDVQFKDLGLLIVDEEQRFGVRHKVKLKELKKTVDVLTMTATPIPRTLHMSLSGIRDMSVINDPPEGRMPIQTFVREAQEDTVRAALVRELDRGGQVFFVHNRVENIGHVARQVQELVPYARVDVAHGQMPESELERVMMDFYERKFDILVCTTIIESGLDVPNANTIVINEADKLGLAQLYQLRGRVGRSDRQAYAYLLYKPDKALSDVAEKRLEAIREFTELGSGFRIAMRDLEIRGAGNLLGQEQSGNMSAVGFDLYCQLLSRAVAELKGEETAEVVLPQVDLPVDAYIPQSYMSNEAHRILFYKKLASVTNSGDVQAVQDELEDRFGDPPKCVWNLLAVVRLRLRLHEHGLGSVTTAQQHVHITYGKDLRMTFDVCRELQRVYRRTVFQPDKAVMTPTSNRVISEVEDMVEIIARAFRNARTRVG